MEVKSCTPIPCPSFEKQTLELEHCPTCDSVQLKWHPEQEFSCVDPWHDGRPVNAD